MAEEISKAEFPSSAPATVVAKRKSKWWTVLRWIPSSTDHIIAAEKRLLSLVKTPYEQERVNIGSGAPGSKVRWFRSSSHQPRVSFSRILYYLAKHFQVIAIDQLGWGGSSRPDFKCKSTVETEAWFVDSFEEWRKAKNLTNLILLGHSFGGYIASKYALKHPEHVQHLILVGTAGFSSVAARSERLIRLRATWKGAILYLLWESNFTPQRLVRGLGPWGPKLVRRYTNARFSPRYSAEHVLTEEQNRLLTDYAYHTSAAKASGELCLKYIFAFGAFPRMPLLNSASEWKVPTTFIYGTHDWMNYQGAQEARKKMKVPCEIIRVPKSGHFVFLEKPDGFHSAMLYACRRFLSPNPDTQPFPEGLESA